MSRGGRRKGAGRPAKPVEDHLRAGTYRPDRHDPEHREELKRRRAAPKRIELPDMTPVEFPPDYDERIRENWRLRVEHYEKTGEWPDKPPGYRDPMGGDG